MTSSTQRKIQLSSWRSSTAFWTGWLITGQTDAIFYCATCQTRTLCTLKKKRSQHSWELMAMSKQKRRCSRSSIKITWTSISKASTEKSRTDWLKISKRQARTTNCTKTRSTIYWDRAATQTKFHWPSKMRPLACGSSRTGTSRRHWRSRTSGWSSLKCRIRRRMPLGRNWSRSWRNWGKWRSIWSRKRLRMVIWRKYCIRRRICGSSGINQRRSCWKKLAERRWTRQIGCPTCLKQWRPKMKRFGGKHRPWRRKWIWERLPLFINCLLRSTRTASKTSRKSNSLTIKSKMLKVILSLLNNQINKSIVLLLKELRHSNHWSNKRMQRQQN